MCIIFVNISYKQHLMFATSDICNNNYAPFDINKIIKQTLIRTTKIQKIIYLVYIQKKFDKHFHTSNIFRSNYFDKQHYP